MITYVKQFITDCITLTAPLLAILGKGANFDWTPIREFNFCQLKDKLLLTPILRCPIRNINYQTETNAFNAAIGDVLQILTEGYLMVI